ncbi:hypothetical protein F66182_642 [Fusarium sp. NRRL 66182]|nr:hypothetical protein F66182_642 [Fusarium sp. NRRL 66182]
MAPHSGPGTRPFPDPNRPVEPLQLSTMGASTSPDLHLIWGPTPPGLNRSVIPRDTSSPHRINNFFYNDQDIQGPSIYSERQEPTNPFGSATSSSARGSSPSFSADLGRRNGHTPSNSTQSQRPVPGHTASFSNQSVNSRAFTHNSRHNGALDLETFTIFDQQMAELNVQDTGGSHVAGPSTNPRFKAVRLNPGSQSWSSEGNAQRINGNFNTTGLGSATQPHAVHRASIDRIPLNHRPEQGSSPGMDIPGLWTNSTAAYGRPIAEHEQRFPTSLTGQTYHMLYSSQVPAYHPGDHSQYIDPLAQRMPHGIMSNAGFGPQFPIQQTRGQGPSHGSRSEALERFCNSKTAHWSLKEIAGHVVEFSGDQQASRFIQGKLEKANSDEKQQVFEEIGENALQLMKDPFGNYVMQKLFEHGSQVQKGELAEKMKGHVFSLSVNKYACRVVQSAVSHCLVEQLVELVHELKPNITDVIQNEHGNHVVQRILKFVPAHHVVFIAEVCENSAFNLATHVFGCRVLQRQMESARPEDRDTLMAKLHPSMERLINHEFGNYVAQHVIEKGSREDRHRVTELVLRKLLVFSKDKFSSNVVELCIKHGSEEQRTRMREKFCGEDGPDTLLLMLSDQYGNYVIKKLIEHLSGTEREELIEMARPLYRTLVNRGMSRSSLQNLGTVLGLSGPSPERLQVEVDSPDQTPVLTNETNSPQSDGLSTANSSAIGVLSDMKNSEVTLKVQSDEA